MADKPVRRVVLVWLATLFVIWSTPCILLVSVSEQEVYRLAIITVLVTCFGCWACLRSGVLRLALPAVVVWCIWISVSGFASIQKSILIRNNALVAAEMLEEIGTAIGDVSETETVWVYVTPSGPPARYYSVLHLPKPILRMGALPGLPWYLKKPDLKVEIFLPGEETPVTSLESPGLKRLRVNIFEGSAELLRP